MFLLWVFYLVWKPFHFILVLFLATFEEHCQIGLKNKNISRENSIDHYHGGVYSTCFIPLVMLFYIYWYLLVSRKRSIWNLICFRWINKNVDLLCMTRYLNNHQVLWYILKCAVARKIQKKNVNGWFIINEPAIISLILLNTDYSVYALKNDQQ